MAFNGSENSTILDVNNDSWYYFVYDILQGLSSIFYLMYWLISALPWWLIITTFVTGLVVLFYLLKLRLKVNSTKLLKSFPEKVSQGRTVTIGFFHPYCNAGGGGERVLWCAVRALQERYDFIKIVIYTGDTDTEGKKILAKAKQRFGIDIKNYVHFIHLHKRHWVTAERYPFFTLLGQSFGSVILGMEALLAFCPDIYIDTMGYAFTLPLFKYIGECKTCSYVHYPTISTDMLSKITERREDFNNAGYIARNLVLSKFKLVYYKLFALLYGICGRCSDIVMVNSSWTNNHIKLLWNPDDLSTVYPPCNTKSLQELFMDENGNGKLFPYQIISLAQFRPEKNHSLQLKSFAKFIDSLPREKSGNYKLLMVGSCRNDGDRKLVEELKAEALQLGIDELVEFHLNIPYQELKTHLAQSVVGIHTMKDEHFGIGVVEFMAGGLVTLAHNSAGPKMDIVIPWNDMKTGFLADSCNSYVAALQEIFSLKTTERYNICKNARECVNKRFSEETFTHKFLSVTEKLFT